MIFFFWLFRKLYGRNKSIYRDYAKERKPAEERNFSVLKKSSRQELVVSIFVIIMLIPKLR